MTLYEKKRLICAVCLTVAIAGLTVIGIFIFTSPQREDVRVDITELESPNEALAPVQEIYLLRSYRQIIGIFAAEGRLIETINLPTVTLPKSERDRLADGIEVYSREELDRLIESYS